MSQKRVVHSRSSCISRFHAIVSIISRQRAPVNLWLQRRERHLSIQMRFVRLRVCWIVVCHLFVCSPITLCLAQDFYPLHVGDIWQYKTYSQGKFVGYLTETITKDTVMPNGRRYFVFNVEVVGTTVVRMDDSLTSYCDDYWNLDSDTSTTELIMNRFNAAVGTSWPSFCMPLPGGVIAKMEDSYTAVWFDGPIEVKRISYKKPSGLWVADHYYSKKHGLIYTVEEGDSQFELTGARIEGTVYGVITDVTNREKEVPESFLVTNPYPNPFNPTTTIEFDLPHEGIVSLKIFNLLGEEVATLAQSTESAGRHKVVWNGRDRNDNPVSSGVYLYSLHVGQQTTTRKLILLR
jgi:hypothetical protein